MFPPGLFSVSHNFVVSASGDIVVSWQIPTVTFGFSADVESTRVVVLLSQEGFDVSLFCLWIVFLLGELIPELGLAYKNAPSDVSFLGINRFLRLLLLLAIITPDFWKIYHVYDYNWRTHFCNFKHFYVYKFLIIYFAWILHFYGLNIENNGFWLIRSNCYEQVTFSEFIPLGPFIDLCLRLSLSFCLSYWIVRC